MIFIDADLKVILVWVYACCSDMSVGPTLGMLQCWYNTGVALGVLCYVALHFTLIIQLVRIENAVIAMAVYLKRGCGFAIKLIVTSDKMASTDT